jgi:acyl-CoA synthetase (AMP-forming)/AMP-acid ligase II
VGRKCAARGRTANRHRRVRTQTMDPARFDALSYLQANAERAPESLAIWQHDRQTTFGELLQLVCGLMLELERRVLEPHPVIVVALPNVDNYVALEIAIPATGATLLPISMQTGARELRSVLVRSKARLLITDSSIRGNAARSIATLLETPVPTADAEDVRTAALARVKRAGFDVQTPRVPPDPDRIVQLAPTSGTTGMPKLASLSARLKQMTFEGFTQRLRITAEDRMFPMSPITQGVGEMCLYALRCGAGLVMLGDERFTPEIALSTMQRSAATMLAGVPTMLVRLSQSLAATEFSFEDLRVTVSAGSPLPPSVAERWEQLTNASVGSFYGAMDIGQLAVPDPEDPAEKRWTSVGRPHDAAQWQICGADGNPLSDGQTGEVCMRGPLVQDRYWDDGSSPYSDDGWAHFGDLGFVDTEGFLHITGRAKDTIIRGGNNINPVEVEDVLRLHPLIRDACVVGRPDPDLGERAVAFLVHGGTPSLTHDDLASFLAQQGLSRYKWPEQVVDIDELPTGATGKVDRKLLRGRAAELNIEVAR